MGVNGGKLPAPATGVCRLIRLLITSRYKLLMFVLLICSYIVYVLTMYGGGSGGGSVGGSNISRSWWRDTLSPPGTEDAGTMSAVLDLHDSDPALLSYIRRRVLVPPAPKSVLSLSQPWRRDYSQFHQGDIVLRALRRDSTDSWDSAGRCPRYFVEAGAHDGEKNSNTLRLERDYNWTGLLVEPDPVVFRALRNKMRGAYLANVALSPTNRSANLDFLTRAGYEDLGGFSYAFSRRRARFMGGAASRSLRVFSVPLYSLLLALNWTRVDYLSLDVELAEVDVLRTIPFDKVYIRLVGVEYTVSEDNGNRNGKLERQRYREIQKFFKSLSSGGVNYRQIAAQSSDMFFMRSDRIGC